MALRLTLKPNEKIIVNGCVIRNSDRRQVIMIENRADVVRDKDLLKEDEAGSPVKSVYFFIQSALLRPEIREEITPVIQKRLGKLVPVFHEEVTGHIFEAANHISQGQYYNAMRSLKEVMNYEDRLLELISKKSAIAAE